MPKDKDVAKGAGKVWPDIKGTTAETDTSMKAPASCAGDVKDMKDGNGTLRAFKRMSERILADYDELEDQALAMPKDLEEPDLKL